MLVLTARGADSLRELRDRAKKAGRTSASSNVSQVVRFNDSWSSR
jgi:hypothetical protein